MKQFVWLDAQNVANLDAVAYFRIEADDRVQVFFRGVPPEQSNVLVESSEAEALIAALKRDARALSGT